MAYASPTAEQFSLNSTMSEDSLEKPLLSDQNAGGDNCKDQDKDDPVEFLDREVFPVLLPCLEQMLFAAKANDVLKVQKSQFSGLDYLAELLWNRNPLHPERRGSYVPIFDVPFTRTLLEHKPRPVYPKSWLWTPEQAAVVIQAAVRGHLVRRRADVQELRQFWRALAEDRSSKIEEMKY